MNTCERLIVLKISILIFLRHLEKVLFYEMNVHR